MTNLLQSAVIKVRTLEPGDNAVYQRLWLQGLTEQSSFFRSAPEDDPAANIPTRFTPDSFTLGAFFERELIGIVSLERDHRVKLRHRALIFRMFVRPSAAGGGVGKMLLQELMRLAQGIAGLRYTYLTVLASNQRAIGLYSSLGFKAFACEPGAVNIDGSFVDELQMACQLSAALQ